MNQRTYDEYNLVTPAEAPRAGPPWWLPAILFGSLILPIVVAVMFVACPAV